MARPKKEKELKQNHPAMLRFNDTEYEIITENAKAAQLPRAEFLRKFYRLFCYTDISEQLCILRTFYVKKSV